MKKVDHPNILKLYEVFEDEDECAVISGDNGDAAALFKSVEALGIEKPTTVFHELTFQDDVRSHTYYKDLAPYQDQYQVFGYHCDPRDNPADNPIPLVANHPEYLI